MKILLIMNYKIYRKIRKFLIIIIEFQLITILVVKVLLILKIITQMK
jgi:hypothetical protein